MDEKEQKQLLMDLDVVMRSSDCPYIVQFYGALFREVRQNWVFTVVVIMADSWKNFRLSFRVTAGFAWSSWLPH